MSACPEEPWMLLLRGSIQPLSNFEDTCYSTACYSGLPLFKPKVGDPQVVEIMESGIFDYPFTAIEIASIDHEQVAFFQLGDGFIDPGTNQGEAVHFSQSLPGKFSGDMIGDAAKIAGPRTSDHITAIFTGTARGCLLFHDGKDVVNRTNDQPIAGILTRAIYQINCTQ